MKKMCKYQGLGPPKPNHALGPLALPLALALLLPPCTPCPLPPALPVVLSLWLYCVCGRGCGGGACALVDDGLCGGGGGC